MNQYTNKERVHRPYEQIWVKKRITNIEWKNWYSKQAAYCFLRQEHGGVIVGFVVAEEIPMDCQKMNQGELLQVDDYRKAKNIAPRPLQDVNVRIREISVASKNALEKLREHIQKFYKRFKPNGEFKELEDINIEKETKTESISDFEKELVDKKIENEKIEDQEEDKRIDVKDIPF